MSPRVGSGGMVPPVFPDSALRRRGSSLVLAVYWREGQSCPHGRHESRPPPVIPNGKRRPPLHCNSAQALPRSRNGGARNAGSTGASSVRPSSARPSWRGQRNRSGMPSGPGSLPSSNAMQAKPTRLLCARWPSSGSAFSFGVGRSARRTMNPSISQPSTAGGHP